MRTLHHLLLLGLLALGLTASAQPNTWTRVADIGYNVATSNRAARVSAVTFSIGGTAYMGTGRLDVIGFGDLWAYDPVSNSWSQRADLPGAVRSNAVGFAVSGKGYVGTGETLNGVLLNDLWEYDPTANSWTQRAAFPGAARSEGFAFTIGTKAYVGAGTDVGNSLLNDFHEYDPTTNTWTARTNLPAGSGRQGPSGFAIAGKGYCAGGYNGTTTTNALLEYDPVADTWIPRAALPATGRMFAVAFTMGTKGHLATGRDLNNVAFNDHWEYDPTSNAWTQRANVPGLGRRSAMAFELNGLGYIGLGSGPNGQMDDMHAFNPTGNSWTARASFGELARRGAASFTVNGKGYVGGGLNDNVLSDLWEFDPLTNSWAQRADLPGVQRVDHVMFAIGNKGYMGTGLGAAPLNDFWEYDPLTNAWTAKAPVPGTGVFRAASFVIGTKGYVCTGQKANSQMTNELQEYDPATNTWTGRAPVPTFGFDQAAGFAIGDRGYLIGGLDPVNGEKNSNYSYHQPSNTWETNSDMPVGRSGHVAFTIGERGYVATGRLNGSLTTAGLIEFNPVTGNWTSRASLPNYLEEGTAFAIGERGYVATGLFDNASIPYVYRYQPARDVSVQISPFGGILCPGGTKYVKYSPSIPFNAGNTFTVELSDATGNFSAPTILGSASTTGGGTIPVVIPAGLPLGTGYRIRMVASDPVLVGDSFGNFQMIAACTNDNPCEATELTMNPNYTCSVTSPGSFPAFLTTLTINVLDNCSGYFNDVWFRFTATSTSHRIQLAGNTTGLQHSIFQGDCGTLTQVPGSVCPSGATANNPTGLIIGNTYWVRAGIIAGSNYNSSNGPFTICVSAPPVIDMRASALAAPLTNSCVSSTQPVSITVQNAAFNPIDFSANPVTVTTNVTGAVTATLTATLNTGTLAPGASVIVPMTPALNMSANGAYTFNASTSVAGDGNMGNNAMTAVTITPWFAKAMPVTQNFTGFAGGLLNGLVAPNDGWRTGTGLALPDLPVVGMAAGTPAQQTQLGAGPTARLIFNSNQSGTWLLSPRFVPTGETQVSYRIAITESSLGTPEPAGMQPGESVIVHVSTDCGLTYTPLFTHNSVNTVGVTNALVQQFVDLSAFAGQEVIVAFQSFKPTITPGHPEYDFHLDDINIQNFTPCSGIPTVGTASTSAPGPYCAPANGLLLLSGQGAVPGVQVTWRSSTVPGGPYTTIPGATGATVSMSGLPVGTSFIVAAVTCSASGQSSLSNEVPVVVNPTPTANAGNNGPACAGQSIQLAGVTDIGTGFNWSGPGGFASTSQNPLLSNVTIPQAGTYSFTTTLAGCTSPPSTTAVSVTPAPQFAGVTGTPNPICINGTSQLTATIVPYGPDRLSFAVGTGMLDPMVGATQALGSGNDDTPTASPINIGFPFFFNGVSHTQFSVSPDGWIMLGGTAASAEYDNFITSSTNTPKIYPYWDDLATGTTGNVQYVVTGSAPDRILKVQWFLTIPRAISGPANSTFQAWLYEGSGNFEFRYGPMGPATSTASLGATASATTFRSVTISTGTASSTVANDANAGQPVTGTTYAFSVPSVNYLWTPGTLLSANNIHNPVFGPASAGSYPYSVVATDPATGCTSTGNITITANPALSSGQANITPAAPVLCGPSGTTTLTANPTSGGAPYTYAWTRPNLAAGSTSQTQVADAAGTWSVLITDACGGSATASVVVVQVTIPTASASSTPACLGQTLQLSGSSDVGTTYAWTGPNGFSSTQQNPSITPVTAGTAGTFTLIASANGCSSSPSSVVVSVQSPPTITSVTATPGAICPNGSSQLQATAPSGGAVPQYSFSSSLGTYSSIAGLPGTVVINSGTDDSSFGPFVLGFNFTYNGNVFTTAGVSANGTVAMGTSAPSSYTALTGSTNNVIVPFNEDLLGSAANGAAMLYQTTGTPGSRVFTFEWKNWGFYSAGANEVSFQVKLYEGSNVVQFVYQNGTATGSKLVGVGLRGTSASAFLNRTTTTDWSGTTAGGANTATCTVSATVRPANGLTFTWTPPSASFAWAPATFLNNVAIANPLASAVTATTAYTVTATDPATGCSSTAPVTVALSTVDTDGDGVIDCIDSCPSVAGQIGSSCNDGNSSTINDVLDANCACAGTTSTGVQVAARMQLDGPFNSGTGLMSDNLRTLGLVPANEPYTGLGYAHVGGGGETTSPAVLATTGTDAIVDWVLLELRSSADPTNVLATRSALVQRDGDVVDVDGISPVSFSLPPGSYHLAVLHRNHLACMTANAFALSASPQIVDLSNSTTPAFGTEARKSSGGKMVLWAGDVTFDDLLIYTGQDNDRDPILSAIGGTIPTNTITGYHSEDVNLDGIVIYSGQNNDRDPILQNIGGTVPTATRSAQMP
jgi:N-acetylneuraminic acid mutarotase